MVVRVIGGGLAGSEACYQLLKRGVDVELYEMRCVKKTPCHHTDNLAELVCSNSLKSIDESTASGMLKKELEILDSLLLRVAKKNSVKAGTALAVNRVKFSLAVERILNSYPNFKRIDEEVVKIDDSVPTIIATGPLTSDALADEIKRLVGSSDDLHFYDAVAPIIDGSTIDMNRCFFAARYGKGDKDAYLNVPFTKEEYLDFYNNLINAKRVILHDFEKGEIFESCMPVEVMAQRGVDSLRFGPLKPVGLYNDNGEKFYAVMQLRREDNDGKMYNIVGFQTNLTFDEQKRVFRSIKGLENAEFYRYGVMHRNTYINAPNVLLDTYHLKDNKNIFFAGQIVGVEGYVESIASGLLAGVNLYAQLNGLEKFVPHRNTIIGALTRHVSVKVEGVRYEPMNANFGILEELDEKIRDKKMRKQKYFERGINLLIDNKLRY